MLTKQFLVGETTNKIKFGTEEIVSKKDELLQKVQALIAEFRKTEKQNKTSTNSFDVAKMERDIWALTVTRSLQLG